MRSAKATIPLVVYENGLTRGSIVVDPRGLLGDSYYIQVGRLGLGLGTLGGYSVTRTTFRSIGLRPFVFTRDAWHLCSLTEKKQLLISQDV